MTSAPATYQGVYGPYTVTAQHRQEVLFYRLSLLLLALAQAGLLIQWRQWGPGFCWPWLLLMGLGLGGALRWVHIYVRVLHRSLQFFWLFGCFGAAVLAYQVGPSEMLPALVAWLPWRCCVGLAGGTRRNLAHPGGTTALDLGRWSLFCCFSWFGFQGILLFSTARSDWPHPPVAPVVAWLARWCA